MHIRIRSFFQHFQFTADLPNAFWSELIVNIFKILTIVLLSILLKGLFYCDKVFTQDLYTWTDENGVTHIGEKKTSNNNSIQQLNKSKNLEKEIDIEFEVNSKYHENWIYSKSRTKEEIKNAIEQLNRLYDICSKKKQDLSQTKNKLQKEYSSLNKKIDIYCPKNKISPLPPGHMQEELIRITTESGEITGKIRKYDILMASIISKKCQLKIIYQK